ncbi:MAG: M1 family metallopeptidase, partial [Anaerolineaceae bacterium]|nr:M1 family metallopeptidase [Anaerolineaceae bacterium]
MLRRLHKLFACFLILTCLLACNVPIDMPVTSTVAPTMTPLPATPEITSSPSPTLTPTLVEPSATLPEPTLPPPTLQPQVLRTRYDFQVEFYPNTHLADIHEQITYINDTGTSMQELTLVVPPNSYENVFTLNGLELANGDLLENYQLNGQTLTIALPAALDAGAQIEVVLRYRLELPPAYGPFGYTSRQNNFGDWYPYVAARDSQNKPLIYARDTVGDNTVQDPADYHVEVELKEDGDWLLAGSSIPQQQDSRMVFDLQAARSFGWSAGLDMIVIHQVEGGVDYRAVIYREHEAAGQEVL